MAATATRHRFTVEEYHRMGEAGIFDEDSRVELIDGDIIEMSPVGSRHVSCVNRLNTTIPAKLGIGSAIIQVQSPIALGPHDEPEPDIALLRFREDYYVAALPRPEDVLLLIEVSDSTLLDDKRRKLPRYARAGIAEVWVVDVDGAAIETYRDPTPDGYRRTGRARRHDAPVASALTRLTLTVEEALGAADDAAKA